MYLFDTLFMYLFDTLFMYLFDTLFMYLFDTCTVEYDLDKFQVPLLALVTYI